MTVTGAADMFFDGLIARVPELATVRDSLVRALGEVVPHMLMADVGRFVVENARDVRLVDDILDYLEESMNSRDEYIVELIAVSFLENMDPSDPSYDSLSSRMGPQLSAELARLRALWN